MNIILASGANIDPFSRPSVADAVGYLALLRNVPLTPVERDRMADAVVDTLGLVGLAGRSLSGREGLTVRTRVINEHLDIQMLGRLLVAIMAVEGKDDANDPVVQAIVHEIAGRLDAGICQAALVRWPDLQQLLDGHYAWKPRGPRERSVVRHHNAQGQVVAEEWFVPEGSYRDAAEGPGRVTYLLIPGQVREEFFIGGEYRPAALGPASVTRDFEGNMVWEQFWTGKRMVLSGGEAPEKKVVADG